ncbi:MAG: dienelactone hydrolase family protein [Pseudomonadota bacterium]
MTAERLFALLICLAILTGCGEKDTATAPADSAPESSADTSEQPADSDQSALREPLAVAGEMFPYSETDDDLIRGYFAFPETMVEPLPAVIMIHEWWGLTDGVKAAAEELAAQGFMVLAVDMYYGEATNDGAKAGALARQLLEDMESGDENLTAAIKFLKDVAGAPVVAAYGWSQGAQWAVRCAQNNGEDISAVVAYYGQPDTDPTSVEAMSAPVLTIHGGEDSTIPMADVRAFREVAAALGKTVDVMVVLEGINGFASPGDRRFNQAHAERAFDRAVGFLHKNLNAARIAQ